MKNRLIIAGSVLAVSAIAYIIYKNQVPPRLTVYSFSPATGNGEWQWGKAAGNFSGLGVFYGGWGWSGELKVGNSKDEKIFVVTKKGKPRASIAISHTGIYKF